MNKVDQNKLEEALQHGKFTTTPIFTKIIIIVSAAGMFGTMVGLYKFPYAGESPDFRLLLASVGWCAVLVASVFNAQNRSMVLGLVIGAVLGFLIFAAAMYVAPSNRDEAWAVRQAMKNTNADLPKMGDDETRIDSVSISMELKTYDMNFTLVNYESAEIDKGILSAHFKEITIPAFCADKVFKIWFDMDYTVNTIYHDKVGEVIEKYSMTSSDC